MERRIYTCEGCGRRFRMPELSQFRTFNVHPLDVAAWTYCCPGCMMVGIDRDGMTLADHLQRPFFRLKVRRHYERMIRLRAKEKALFRR